LINCIKPDNPPAKTEIIIYLPVKRNCYNPALKLIKMKPVLTEIDKNDLERRIAEAEKATHAQIVLATVKRSDSYNEIPWKAFAVTSPVAALIVLSVNLFVPAWVNTLTLLMSVLVILGTAVIASILSVLIHPFARLFLSENRAEVETKQYAESMFLRRELFSTSGRNGVLVLVSRFERKVVILSDKGISDSLRSNDFESIISQMRLPLRKGKMRQAMETALDGIIRTVNLPQSGDESENEFPDEVIEERGL
jgi:putative membrane protein